MKLDKTITFWKGFASGFAAAVIGGACGSYQLPNSDCTSGEVMMEQDFTWQAVCVYSVLIAFGILFALLLAAKVVKAWRDALK